MDNQQNNQNQNNQVPLNQEPPVYSEPPQPQLPPQPVPQMTTEPIPETPSEPNLPPQPEPISETPSEPNLSEPEETPIPESKPEAQADSVDDAAAKYQQILNEYAASQKQPEPEISQPEPELPPQPELPSLPESNFETEESQPEPEIYQSESQLPPITEPEYQSPVDETPPYIDSTETEPKSNVFKTLFIIILFINIIVFSAAALIYYKTNQNKDVSDIPQTTPESSMTCSYNDLIYKAGESFPSIDGCNTCSCTETGDNVCTEKACDISPTKAATKSATKVTVTPTKAATKSATKVTVTPTKTTTSSAKKVIPIVTE